MLMLFRSALKINVQLFDLYPGMIAVCLFHAITVGIYT